MTYTITCTIIAAAAMPPLIHAIRTNRRNGGMRAGQTLRILLVLATTAFLGELARLLTGIPDDGRHITSCLSILAAALLATWATDIASGTRDQDDRETQERKEERR